MAKVDWVITEIGGGWVSAHNMYVISSDGVVAHASVFNSSDLSDYTSDFEYKLDSRGVELSSGYECFKSKLYKADLDFTKFNKIPVFVFDAPEYTLYKVKDNKYHKVWSSHYLDGHPSVSFVVELYGLLSEVMHSV